MFSRRTLGIVVASLLVVLAAGCTDGQAPGPGSGVDPTPSAPSSTPLDQSIIDSDGVTTTNDRLPQWQAIPPVNQSRDDFGAAVIGREIWIMGGMTGDRGNRLTSIEIFDTVTQRWRTSRIEMPVGLASFETVARGPLIYLFGGLDKESEATQFAGVLDTRTGRWRLLPPLPNARYSHTVTAYQGKFYVIGGRNDDTEVPQVDIFDPRTETWTTSPTPMPGARASHKTVATPRGLLVVGGFRNYEDSDLVDLYDPATDRWTSMPALPEPMTRAGLATGAGRIWLVLHESGYVMDLRRMDRWVEANALTLTRHGFSMVRVGGVLYAISGCRINPLRNVRTSDRLVLPGT